LFLDAYETEKIALQVVKVMCEEMEKDDSWMEEELRKINLILKKYQL
jgi:hypothetical protein